MWVLGCVLCLNLFGFAIVSMFAFVFFLSPFLLACFFLCACGLALCVFYLVGCVCEFSFVFETDCEEWRECS